MDGPRRVRLIQLAIDPALPDGAAAAIERAFILSSGTDVLVRRQRAETLHHGK